MIAFLSTVHDNGTLTFYATVELLLCTFPQKLVNEFLFPASKIVKALKDDPGDLLCLLLFDTIT